MVGLYAVLELRELVALRRKVVVLKRPWLRPNLSDIGCPSDFSRCKISAVCHPLRVVLCSILLLISLHARTKSAPESYGAGLSVSVPVTEQELLLAVQDVVSSGIIQGSKEYNKDEYISGAEVADRSPAFPHWTGGGRVFYKVRRNALDPRNFKDSGDSGTLAVRYIVLHGDEKSTFLKIDATFVDDFHRRTHLSNGSVESAEYKDIQDHLATMQLAQQHAAEEKQRHEQELAAQELERKHKKQQLEVVVAQAPGETLQQHVEKLHHEVERAVKTPGAKLKSAPFQSASSLTSLAPGSRVAILISTPYWFGVETQDGQHGWIHRSELEQVP
jgi:hypothetical protein